MKEFIKKMIGRLEEQAEQYRRRGFEHEQKGYSAMADKYYGKQCSYLHSIEIVNELAEEYNNGWILCSEKLPEMPKENPLFEYKPLEVYLVSLSSTDYPWRAFWNGKYFTDGFSKVEPIAWMPLPAPYKEGVTENE